MNDFLLGLALLPVFFVFGGMDRVMPYKPLPSFYTAGNIALATTYYYPNTGTNSLYPNYQISYFMGKIDDNGPMSAIQFNYTTTGYPLNNSVNNADIMIMLNSAYSNIGFYAGFGINDNFANTTNPPVPVNQIGFAYTSGIDIRLSNNIYAMIGVHTNSPEIGIKAVF